MRSPEPRRPKTALEPDPEDASATALHARPTPTRVDGKAKPQSMARSRGNAAHDLRQPKVDNASNLSLQGRCQLDQLDAQRRSFLGREVVRWRRIYAAIDNATRQVLGFFADGRNFGGRCRGKPSDQNCQGLAHDGEHRDDFDHSLGAFGVFHKPSALLRALS
jgi:hypothetical protein